MPKRRFLYSSSSRPGIKYLKPAPLSRPEGFRKGQRGVWATDNLALSRAFGIDRKQFGTFYLDPQTKQLSLLNWRLAQISDDLVAYTYVVDPKGFKRTRVRDWKFVGHRKTKVIRVEPYLLRAYLKKHFRIFELTRRRV